MANTYEEKLGTEKMLPLILKMALPSVAAQLVNLLYSIVDRIYIGHIPEIGTDALAGIGVTSSVIMLVAAFANIVGGGGAPLASIALGKGDRERAKRILGNGFGLLVIFAAVTSAAVYIFMEPLLLLTGASEATIGYSMDYLSVYMTGTLFVMLATGLNTFINAQGRPGIGMLSVIIGALLNVVLDPLFIYTAGMGVRGAALATVISQAFSAAWVVGFLASSKASLRLEKRYLRFDGSVVGPIFALGAAPFVMASTESLVGFVLNGSLKNYGDIYVSTLTVLQSAIQFVSIPMAGFGQGIVPVVSYNYGHGSYDRVKQAFRIIVAVLFTFNFVMILTMVMFPGAVASIFNDDPVLGEKVVHALPLFMTGMLIFGLQRACQNMFVALGQAKTSLFIALLRKVILLIPLALILPHWFGVDGVFLAESCADFTAATLCTVIFSVRFPKILAKGIYKRRSVSSQKRKRFFCISSDMNRNQIITVKRVSGK